MVRISTCLVDANQQHEGRLKMEKNQEFLDEAFALLSLEEIGKFSKAGLIP